MLISSLHGLSSLRGNAPAAASATATVVRQYNSSELGAVGLHETECGSDGS